MEIDLEIQRKAMADVKIEQDSLNNVYREIADELGIEAAMTIYHMFRGQQISFPLRFLHPEGVKERICEEFDGANVRELAKKYDYSEKTIRRIIREHKSKEDEPRG